MTRIFQENITTISEWIQNVSNIWNMGKVQPDLRPDKIGSIIIISWYEIFSKVSQQYHDKSKISAIFARWLMGWVGPET